MWEEMMHRALHTMEVTIDQADMAINRGARGILLSMFGMAGWISTENLIWFVPIAISVVGAILNAHTMHRYAQAKARFDLKLYKSVAAKASGVELASLGPETPDPDL